MKKRLLQVIALICVAVTLFSLCACGKQPGSGDDVVAENVRAEHKVTNSLHKGVDNIPDTGNYRVPDTNRRQQRVRLG